MGLFNRKRKTDDFASQLVPTYAPSPVFTSASTWAGPPVSEVEALSIPAFYRGVSLICDHVAQAPFEAFRAEAKLETQPLVLTDPTPGASAYDFWYSLTWSLVVHGNAFLYVTEYTPALYPRSFQALNPTFMTVTQRPLTGEIEYSYAGRKLDPATELVHICGPRPPGAYVGVGVLAAQQQTLAHAIAQNKFSAKYFGEAGMPSGTLTSPSPAKDKDRLRNEWQAQYGDGSRKTAVLDNGLTFTPISANPQDQQLLEARKWTNTEIANALGLPPRFLGGDDSFTYANLEAENASLVQFGLSPWTTRIEQAASLWIVRGQTVKADFGFLLRADAKTKAETDAIRIASNVTSGDEIRAEEGKRPLPKPKPVAVPVAPEPTGKDNKDALANAA